MLRPLVSDFLGSLAPLGVGASAFLLGRFLHYFSKPLRLALISIAICSVTVVGLALCDIIPTWANRVFSFLGGPFFILSWAALFLFGVVWSAPHRRFSTGFLSCLVLVATTLLVLEGSGRLWWRFFASSLWERTVDSQGLLRQSNGLTCSPVAGVLLLHHYGIETSEGEMAYLANTSVFGTDAYGLAEALEEMGRERGLHGDILRIDYEGIIQRGGPFVAHLRKPDIGGHAVLVERIEPDYVEIIDPLDGLRTKTTRADFVKMWDGTAIGLE
jgi:hypothetical protein